MFNHSEGHNSGKGSGNVSGQSATLRNPPGGLALEDEFYLGRDYEKREAAYELKAPAQLEDTGGVLCKICI